MLSIGSNIIIKQKPHLIRQLNKLYGILVQNYNSQCKSICLARAIFKTDCLVVMA